MDGSHSSATFDENDASLPILNNSTRQNFSSLQRSSDSNVELHIDIPPLPEHGQGQGGYTLGRSSSAGTVLDPEPANVRLSVLQNGREQADAATYRYHAYAVTVIGLPQAVAALIIIFDKWNSETCEVNLHIWGLVQALRLLTTIYIAWGLRWENVSDPEQMSDHGRLLYRIKSPVDNFGIIWLVMGNFWLLKAAESCISTAPTVYYLCAVLIYIGFIVIFLPCIVILLMLPFVCFCLPCLIRVLARIADVSNGQEGASEEEINKLPSATYRPGMFSEDDDQCTICLTGYQEEEELRLLPCDKRHHFHKECVDSWLILNATCPICRASIHPDADTEEQHSETASLNALEQA